MINHVRFRHTIIAVLVSQAIYSLRIEAAYDRNLIDAYKK